MLNTGPPADYGIPVEIDVAVAAVQGSWRESFPRWAMPTIWNGNGLYDSAGRDRWTERWRQGPTCGGDRAERLDAFYCHVIDTVTWDLALIEENVNSPGPMFIDVAVAHEIAHAAQQCVHQAGQGSLVCAERDAGGLHRRITARRRECRRPYPCLHRRSRPDARTLIAVADAEPWHQPGDHGDAGQRMTAFDEGATRTRQDLPQTDDATTSTGQFRVSLADEPHLENRQ